MVNLDICPPRLDEQRKYWVNLDLLNYKSLEAFFIDFQPTHILHLAARTDLDEKRSIYGYAANIEGVRNLIRAANNVSSVQRIIIASSMLVCKVGYIPKSDDDYYPINLYAKSKVKTEIIVKSGNLDCVWTIVRPTTIWGPYHSRLQNGFFRILQNKIYFHPGNKKCYKSYGYVKNTIFQIQRIFEAHERDVHKKTLYLADDPIRLDDWVNKFSQQLVGTKAKILPYSFIKLFALIGDLIEYVCGKKFIMNTFRLRNMTTNNVVDTTTIKRLYSSLPFSLAEGINETSSWILKCNKKK